MSAEPDLLPCPFCGGRAERIDFGPGDAENEGGSCIACTGCQSSGPVEFGYKENFISNWNRRATAARDAEVEALRAEVTEWKRVASAQAELHGEAEARAERLAGALRDARDYVTSELAREREAFKGYEHASDIASIEADLAKIDAALDQETTNG